MAQKPAVSLAAMPKRRHATLEIAHRLEHAGFTGIYCPSMGDCVGLCEALALATHEIPFGTAIAPIYFRQPFDYAQTAALIHEISDGRFRFGIGVSHGPVHQRLGLQVGKPLADIRKFVQDLQSSAPMAGSLPPLMLATLRKPMVKLAGEIAQGAVWANAARSHMHESLKVLPPEKQQGKDFIIANMVPTVVDDDKAAAAAVNRKTLSGYVRLPNYQQYWIEAGFEEEMRAIQKAIENKEEDKIPQLMSDRWLSQVTLYGNAKEVREGVEAWYDSGVNTLIVVPSSARGNQMVALEQVIAAFQ